MMHNADDLDDFLAEESSIYDQQYPYYFNTKITKKRKNFIKAKKSIMKKQQKRNGIPDSFNRPECDEFPDLFEKDC